ncbi:MAG TPA: hypothetical protein VNY24_00505 [Candidatus Acidoferrales bacterium]|jgi:hypothetical protein|nr:hypothetical protein [Candidatus Acidoferrales bacterium]
MGKTKKRADDAPRKDTPDTTQENPRRALFNNFYRMGGPGFPPGNAFRSAIAAGYTVATAKSNCHLLAREARVRTAEALEALGCDGFSQGGKLLQLREAKTVKWNPSKGGTKKTPKGGWDVFEDNDTQLRTTQEINKIQGAYPDPAEGTAGRPIQIIFPRNFSDALTKESAED